MHQDESVLILGSKHKYAHLKTHRASQTMHQKLAIILWQFNYSKNGYIALIPGSRHRRRRERWTSAASRSSSGSVVFVTSFGHRERTRRTWLVWRKFMPKLFWYNFCLDNVVNKFNIRAIFEIFLIYFRSFQSKNSSNLIWNIFLKFGTGI